MTILLDIGGILLANPAGQATFPFGDRPVSDKKSLRGIMEKTCSIVGVFCTWKV